MTRASLDKHSGEVASMFDSIATRYDLLNDLLTMGLVRDWRRSVVAELAPRPGMRILDLAAGTGTSSRPLADAGADVYPTDISEGMLAEGRRRYPDLHFTYGDAAELPFNDGFFDAVTISYGLRNVHDTSAVLREMRRVTKPGGELVICEFSTPTSPAFRAAYDAFLTRVVPQIARVSRDPEAYTYLFESILGWPAQGELAQLMADAGWRHVAWRNLSHGIVALHRGFNA